MIKLDSINNPYAKEMKEIKIMTRMDDVRILVAVAFVYSITSYLYTVCKTMPLYGTQGIIRFNTDLEFV
jgi:hypothetical protein